MQLNSCSDASLLRQIRYFEGEDDIEKHDYLANGFCLKIGGK